MKKTDIKKIKKIKSTARKLTLRQFLRTYALDFLKPLAAGGALFTCVFALARFNILPQRPSGAAVFIIVLAALGWAGWKIFKTSRQKPLSLKTVTGELQKEFPDMEDRMVNAISLMSNKDKFSSPLAREVIDGLADETIQKAARIPRGVFSLRKFYKMLGGLLTVVLFFSLLYSTDTQKSHAVLGSILTAAAGRSEFELQVEPGDAKVPQGRDFKVRAISNAPDEPVLQYSILGRDYSSPMEEGSPGEYAAVITRVPAPFLYSVRADRGRLSSPEYEVSLRDPPEVEEIEITYNYPAYTGKAPIVSTAPQITAVRGTVVDIKARSDAALERAYLITGDDEREMGIRESKTVRSSLTLGDQSYYKITLQGKQETVNDPVRYGITVLEDEPPEVELIMPRRDIVVSPDARVQIRGRAEDEFGLNRIYIRYYIGVGGEYREELIKRAPSKSEEFSYTWDIARTPAGEGSVITYAIVAEDINTLYGPRRGYSKELRIEIEDFSAHHREVLEKGDELTEKIFDLLEKSYDTSMLIETEEYDEAFEEAGIFEEMASESLEFLKSLLEDMQQDPYMDSSVMEEYSGLSERLEKLAEGDIPELSEMVKEESADSEEKSREISQELERLSSLSEQASGRQRMSDVLASAEDTLNKTGDLTDLLEEDAAPEDIMRQLAKLQDLMDRMMEALLESPDKLPDEFMHDESMEKMDFEQTRQQFSELQEALAEGDYEKARELLEKFSSALEDMLQTMHSASGDTYGDEMEELNSRMLALTEQLQETAEKQAALIEKTEASLDKLKERRDEYDREKLKELKDRFSILQSTVGRRFPEIVREFEQGYLYRTGEILSESIEEFEKEWKKERIKEFIGEIKEVPEDERFMSGECINEIESQKLQQDEIREMTETLRQGFESFSHQTAMMDMEIIENLEKAGNYMGMASGELESLSPAPALEHERTAYSYLVESSQKSRELMEKMMSLPQQMAAGRPRGFQRTGDGTQPGRRGFREGYVEIPAPGEDITGEEFRRRIMESLRKEYPRQYRRLIEEYFRSLSE